MLITNVSIIKRNVQFECHGGNGYRSPPPQDVERLLKIDHCFTLLIQLKTRKYIRSPYMKFKIISRTSSCASMCLIITKYSKLTVTS